jgi:ribosomal protein RSM22 (predicted rRNA methylase)
VDLPADRRRRIEALVEGVSRSDLAERAEAMSRRYRSHHPPQRWTEADVVAYVATRAPATYAAVRAVLAEVAARWPSFAPMSVLDAGAGPGTAAWAAADEWPGIGSTTLLEREPAFATVGRRLDELGTWRSADLTAPADWPASDLVVLAYVTTELTDVEPVVRRAYDAADEVVVVVEPGTPEGFRRLLEVRDVLISARATLLAPCPHAERCPLDPAGSGVGWCHFSQRVARSRLHREVKRANAPWEEERYCYVAFTRSSDDRRTGRVLAPPKVSKGEVTLDLCEVDGRSIRTIRRSDRAAYARARKLRWGSAWPASSDGIGSTG